MVDTSKAGAGLIDTSKAGVVDTSMAGAGLIDTSKTGVGRYK